jgi:hypothetical protein
VSDETVSEKPLLRVVRGNPDDTELAVLTAVVSALSAVAPGSSDEPATPSQWGKTQLRQPLTPGPSAWRYSMR